MTTFWLLLSVAHGALATQATESPGFVFDWSNTSNGHMRRVEVLRSPRDCLGRIFENTDVLYSAHLPVTFTTARIRALRLRLTKAPQCARAKPGMTSDGSLHSWQVNYFTARTQGTATSAQSACFADQTTVEIAQAFIEEVAALAKNLQSHAHGD